MGQYTLPPSFLEELRSDIESSRGYDYILMGSGDEMQITTFHTDNAIENIIATLAKFGIRIEGQPQ